MNIYDNAGDFIEVIGPMMKNRMDMSFFNGEYDCVCGKKHIMQSSLILAQGKWKVLTKCPEDNRCFTFVEIKTGFLRMGFKGFESLNGLVCSDEEESDGVLSYLCLK
jgi:hypothetical protein